MPHRDFFHSLVSLDELLEASGPAFLGKAYVALLGRPIDPGGFRAYDARLRAGASRLSIIDELARSDEGRAHGAIVPGLATRLAREQVESRMGVTSVGELMQFDGGAFVDMAWRAVTGELPDAELRNRFAADLFAGIPKEDVLLEIHARRGAKPPVVALEGIDEIVASARSGLHPVVSRVDALLALEDLAFIDCAFKTLLKRAPDAAGFAHYLRQLREGASKWTILTSLRRSSEGQAAGCDIEGLRNGMLCHSLARLRFFGWFFRLVLGAEGETPQERLLRRLDRWTRLQAAQIALEHAEADSVVASVDRLLGQAAEPGHH